MLTFVSETSMHKHPLATSMPTIVSIDGSKKSQESSFISSSNAADMSDVIKRVIVDIKSKIRHTNLEVSSSSEAFQALTFWVADLNRIVAKLQADT